jgi:Tol biopolymer transport system component
MQLTYDGHVSQFAWSPDGNWLVYVSQAEDSPQMYVIRHDGTGTVPLGAGWDPAWSADGRNIVFQNDEQIWVTSPDGMTKVQLTQQANWLWGNPIVAPDNQNVVVAGVDEISADVFGNAPFLFYTIPITGGALTPLTGMAQPEEGRLPSDLRFSPDGTRFAYFTAYQQSNCFIPGDFRSLNADGSNGHSIVPDIVWSQVTTDTERYVSGNTYTWSPDGSQIVLTASVYECGDVTDAPPTEVVSRTTYVVDPMGVVIRSWASEGREFAWSPDGTQIAYVLPVANREDGIIYVSDTQGESPIIVSAGLAPAWRP